MAMLFRDVMLVCFGSRAARLRLAEQDPALRQWDMADRLAAIDRLATNFRRANVLSLLTLLAAVGAAFVAQWLSLYPLSANQLGLSSGFVFAWAGLGRLGWNEGTYKGKTAVEVAERFVFRAQCFVGMYLAALAAM